MLYSDKNFELYEKSAKYEINQATCRGRWTSCDNGNMKSSILIFPFKL